MDGCLIFEPLYPSRSDTAETQRWALKHDLTGAKLCHWPRYGELADRA